MSNIVQNETDQFGRSVRFGSFQSTEPRLDTALSDWAQLYGYQFLALHLTTPPAGSSAPATDPAGTYSPAGASAPTSATPGTLTNFFRGPFKLETSFDNAVDALPVSTAFQDEAKTYEANVWGSDLLSKYVAKNSYGQGLEFWVETPTLQINVQVEPTQSPLPSGLTQSESVFLNEINSLEGSNPVGMDTYNIINKAYGGSLGLGATVAASGATIWAYVYEPETTTIMMVHPV